jgi:sulfur carrier protein ThiS
VRIYLDRYFLFYTHDHQPWVDVALNEPARLQDVLSGLSIPIGEVHLAVVNGEAVDPQGLIISEQDTIKLFPAFGGG